MGICLSNQTKAERPSHTLTGGRGTSSGDGIDLSNSASITPTPRSAGEIMQSSHLKSYAFVDLKAVTRNFAPDSILGEGGFGVVFKGYIDEQSLAPSCPGPSSVVVAVKRLNQQGCQGHREWLAEINYLGKLRHPNLVKLIGYCIEDDHRLLMYEFMSEGSLENHLFRRGLYFQPLSWRQRMKIALGAARGLAFLHNAKNQVIYRDFKTSNILLDSNFDAKLSDFGLARDGPTGDKTHVTTRIMGTHGYAAPEYLATGHLTSKSDVYSFGVVLLEILTGKIALDMNRPKGEHNLVEWAKPYLTKERRIIRIMDQCIQGQYQVDQAVKSANLALQCLCMDRKSRPNMDEVVAALEQLQEEGC